MHGSAPRKRNRNENGQPLAVPQRDRFELAVGAVQLGDLAAVANRDAVPLELEHEVVGHRLAQVGAAMQERHERAAAGQPDGGLRRPSCRRRSTPTRVAPQRCASGGPAA